MRGRSIFILNDGDHEQYEKIYDQYYMLVALIYEPKQISNVAKTFLRDFFFIMYKPLQQLIIYPELSLSFSYRTIFSEKVMRSKLLKKYGWKFQGNALYSFCCAIYLAQFTTDWLSMYLTEYPERKGEIRLLNAHVVTELERVFEQSYPKDLLIANSNLVKYMLSLTQTQGDVFEQGIRRAYLAASLLYEDLSMEIPKI